MNNLSIGVQIAEPTVQEAVASIVHAETLGIACAWMTLGGVRPDPIAVLAVATARTERIGLGTSIAPLYPRHPIAMAQTAKVVAELAPGRFRLGVGPSHKSIMEQGLGIPYHQPILHLREYLQVLKATLQHGGLVEFAGKFYQIRLDAGPPVDIRIMASALREKSFHLVGEAADGGISWVCPLEYIQEVALPAIKAGAAKAGRPQPAMVMHVPIVVHDNAAEVHEAAARQLSIYAQLSNYIDMFALAGFPEARETKWSVRMLDAVVVHGDETTVSDRLHQIADAGVAEVICSVIRVGQNPDRSVERTLRLLGEI